MLFVSKEKIREMVTLETEPLEKNWYSKVHNANKSLLFLKRNNNIYGYIQLNALILENTLTDDKCIENLLSTVISIDQATVLPKQLSLTSFFQILGASFVLLTNDQGFYVGYVRREDILTEIIKQDNTYLDLLKIILTSIPMGVFVVNKDSHIVNYNDAGLKMIRRSEEDMKLNANNFFQQKSIIEVFEKGKSILNELLITEEMSVLVDYSPIVNLEKEVEGVIIIVQDLPKVEEMAMEIEYIKDINKDLAAILSSIYDGIIVVNHKGELIRYSDSVASNMAGIDLKSLIGKSLLDYKNQGMYLCSTIELVQKKKEKISTIYELEKGRKVLTVGNPVFNNDGELDRIIIASRDITESSQLKSELNEIKKLSEQYKKELETYKSQVHNSKRVIYASSKMEDIIHYARKIADFSSTVLIYGESGVGKEVVAQVIHELGNRKNGPFLKLNCGAIPENLLESELFGYTKGSFTGADRAGKDGYFTRAHKGILFLDEVAELPLHLQVKLLRVLQEQEVIPIGSTTPIKIDVQIIAATNKKLDVMVKEGAFRQDLYYRLNVIPIVIPPLRERPADISVLALHFLKSLNEKYNRHFHFTADALNHLEYYPWPGNVRELQNIIERFVVSAEDDMLDSEFVSSFLSLKYDMQKTKPIITKVTSLQETLDDVEEQLIVLAMKQYETTTKAAKALGISQSSVSRKYQRILQKKENEQSD